MDCEVYNMMCGVIGDGVAVMELVECEWCRTRYSLTDIVSVDQCPSQSFNQHKKNVCFPSEKQCRSSA